MADTNPAPAVGQVWKDNDIRSKGSGEFTIVALNEDGTHAQIHREATGRKHWVKLSRLADTSERGYTFIGRGR